MADSAARGMETAKIQSDYDAGGGEHSGCGNVREFSVLRAAARRSGVGNHETGKSAALDDNPAARCTRCNCPPDKPFMHDFRIEARSNRLQNSSSVLAQPSHWRLATSILSKRLLTVKLNHGGCCGMYRMFVIPLLKLRSLQKVTVPEAVAASPLASAFRKVDLPAPDGP